MKLFRLNTIDWSLGMLRGQLKFLNREFEVVAVADDSGILKEVAEREGVRTIGVPMHREISIAADCRSLVALYKLFRRERPHIVHSNTPKASLLSMVAAWAARVPHRIYLVTGLRFETTHGLLRFILKTMERITCLCATKVIPEGDGVKTTLLREHITRKPLQKIHHGNINGIDLEHFARTPEVMQRATEIRNGSEDFTFIFIGRMVRDKGINELVAAFDRLNREMPATKLLLVGKFEDELDPVLPETKQIIENNPKIEFAGYQNDVRPFLVASDVAVLPSYREGFPNVVIQAGAMGLAQIVTDINGCNEVVIEGQNGVIIPKQNEEALYDAMRRLATDHELTARMAASAREMVATRYRQEDVWAELLKMYKSL
ncbi:MAG: glycosyltransferase family 4 protein [Rikenellaceae bacterium]|nr:glycosyltransferase family 4 protein [Rikenellaceae bacterium]MBR6662292.1 glycosyltransferase family 4 protein [Alistipes sp.]